MAGIQFIGTVAKFGPTGSEVDIKHLTDYSLNVSGSEISQIVADQTDALALAGAPVKSWSFSFAIPSDQAAAQLNMLDADETGALIVELHESLGGTLLATWTSNDDQCKSGGCGVNGSGSAFTLGQVTITTNGGTWS